MTPTYPAVLNQFVVVLCEPRLAINVGTVMRAMKNMGLSRLRLVNPAEMDLDKTQISAHRTEDILEQMEVFESLDAALADCHRTVGLTARPRTRNWAVHPPRKRAPALLAEANEGRQLALVFGRERSGLTNDELERCDEFMTIPTRRDYASLNLAQAVLLICHELFMAASDGSYEVRQVDDRQPATRGDVARLVAQIEHTLNAISFFSQTGANEGVMHKIRRLLSRSRIDEHETRILTGIFVELLKFAQLVRRGIIPADLPQAAVSGDAVKRESERLQTRPDEG